MILIINILIYILKLTNYKCDNLLFYFDLKINFDHNSILSPSALIFDFEFDFISIFYFSSFNSMREFNQFLSSGAVLISLKLIYYDSSKIILIKLNLKYFHEIIMHGGV